MPETSDCGGGWGWGGRLCSNRRKSERGTNEKGKGGKKIRRKEDRRGQREEKWKRKIVDLIIFKEFV